jgi:hypothetical protein
MANCTGECNKQLQGLAARLSHAEDNITNHFMGVSTLVSGLASNPLTLGSVTALLPTYNSLPSGMELLQLLKDALPDVDALTIKKLMMSASEAAMDTLAATMDEVGAAMIATATNAVSAAEGVVTSTAASLTAAIQTGNQIAIDAAQAAHDLANVNLGTSKLSFDSISGFIVGQAKISKCKTKSFLLGD